MLTGQILLQLIVILLVVQLCGFLCKRIGQQWVIGEILAGLALGPSLLGAVWPALKAFIFPVNAFPTLQTLGEIGLVIYMFSLGTRLDTNLMLSQSRKAVVASFSGIVFPLLLGCSLALFIYPGLAGARATPLSFILMVGTAMSITAFPVLARLLTEKQMVGSRIGTLALTCAALNDIVAWFLLALLVAIIHATGLFSVIIMLGITALFVAVMFLIIRPLLIWADHKIHEPQPLVLLTMVLLLLSAYVTNIIGIHPIFGAFVMGIILPRRATFITHVRSMDQLNNVLFLPLFFVYSGLRTQIGLISAPGLWLICLLVLSIACIGKIVGCALPVRWIGESWKDALTLGVLMNTRGLVELIVLNIGLDLGVLSPTMFAMLVIMALVTTMMAAPLLPLFGYRQKKEQAIHEDTAEQAIS